MRYLGIDYGAKRIGLALSDEAGRIGFPHGVLENNKEMLEKLGEYIKKEKVKVVVIGESKDLDGTPNPIHAGAMTLAENLKKQFEVEIAFEPEYYTTKQARDAQALYGKNNHSTERVDASAAAIILNSYLERHGNNR